jgi:hypothetical protein
MSMGVPQKHRATPLGRCVGSLQPSSHMAYFHAVRARCRRYSSKSASGSSRQSALALQLPFMELSESMGNHDSKIVGADSVD